MCRAKAPYPSGGRLARHLFVPAGSNLAHKLREKRVQWMIEPMLSGVPGRDISTHDYEHLRDLDLIAHDEGSLESAKLRASFQQVSPENAEHWLERFGYKERAQLLLQALLRRVFNGVGRIQREYGLGYQRVDLLLL